MDWIILCCLIYVVAMVVTMGLLVFQTRKKGVAMSLGAVFMIGLLWWVIWPIIFYESRNRHFQRLTRGSR